MPMPAVEIFHCLRGLLGFSLSANLQDLTLRVSRTEKIASAEASRISQAVTRSMPAPMHAPCAAAITGSLPQPLQRIGNAPPRGLGAVLEVRFHAPVGDAQDFVGDLVDLLVVGIACRQRHLRAFLEVDHHRDGEFGVPGQLPGRRRAAIAHQVAHLAHALHVFLQQDVHIS